MNKNHHQQASKQFTPRKAKPSISKSSRGLFLVYIGGIFVAMALAYLITYQGLPPGFLLAEGCLHLICLVILGIASKSPSLKLYAGERIQTAGYLHTLIGFSVAIGLVGTKTITINNVQELLTPMSSALWTSIIGWLCGSEIAAQGNELGERAQINVAESLNGKTNNSGRSSLHPGIEESEHLAPQLSEQTIHHLVTKIENSNESLIKTFRKLSLQLEEESQSLIKTFRKLSLDIEEESRSFPKAVDNFSSVLKENSRTLLLNFDDLREESKKVALSMSDIADAARKAANYLDNISTRRG